MQGLSLGIMVRGVALGVAFRAVVLGGVLTSWGGVLMPGVGGGG